MAEKADINVSPDLEGKTQQVEYTVDAKNRTNNSSGELVTVEQGFIDVDINLSPEERKRILRKCDYGLVPVLAFLYLVAFVDRSNIGNAKIAGLTKDLHLEGMQYKVAVTMFFVTYGLFEVPSNIVLKLMRPSRWIAIIMFCWGTIMTYDISQCRR